MYDAAHRADELEDASSCLCLLILPVERIHGSISMIDKLDQTECLI